MGTPEGNCGADKEGWMNQREERRNSGLRRIPQRTLSETFLKKIAVFTMLVDHVAVIFLERTLDTGTGVMLAGSSDVLYSIDRGMRAVGRQAFPIFAFCIVEGFFHTRSRGRYLARLAGVSALSQLPFMLMNNTGPVGRELPVSLNTMTTLAWGLLLIWLVELLLRPEKGGLAGAHGLLRAAGAIVLASGAYLFSEALRMDYGGMGVTAVLLVYLLRRIPQLAPTALWLWLGCGDAHEWFALPGCLLLYGYDGTRGTEGMSSWKRRREKYFFYLFYPLHLLGLWGIRRIFWGY